MKNYLLIFRLIKQARKELINKTLRSNNNVVLLSKYKSATW